MFVPRTHRVFVAHFLVEKLIGVFIINTSGPSSWKRLWVQPLLFCFVVESQRLFKTPQLKAASRALL